MQLICINARLKVGFDKLQFVVSGQKESPGRSEMNDDKLKFVGHLC